LLAHARGQADQLDHLRGVLGVPPGKRRVRFEHRREQLPLLVERRALRRNQQRQDALVARIHGRGSRRVIRRRRIDAHDADGAALGVHHHDARDERILTLLVSAQRAALEEQRVLLAPVMESYTALARGYAEYAAQVVELVRLARDAALERQSDSGADAALAALASKVVGAQTVGAPTKPNGAA